MLLSINSSQADGKNFVLAVMNSTRLCRPVLEHLFSGYSLKNGNIKIGPNIPLLSGTLPTNLSQMDHGNFY